MYQKQPIGVVLQCKPRPLRGTLPRLPIRLGGRYRLRGRVHRLEGPGARSVVASLWEVHDESTVSLMKDFYERLTGGAPVAEALAQAQRGARRRDPMALRWAPFIVVGEPNLTLPRGRVA